MITEASCTRPPSLALHQRHLVDDRHQPRARTVFVKDPERKCMRQALEREHTVIGWPRSFEAPQARLISHVQQYIPLCVVRDTGPATSVAGLSFYGTIPNGMRRCCSGHNDAEKRLVKVACCAYRASDD